MRVKSEGEEKTSDRSLLINQRYHNHYIILVTRMLLDFSWSSTIRKTRVIPSPKESPTGSSTLMFSAGFLHFRVPKKDALLRDGIHQATSGSLGLDPSTMSDTMWVGMPQCHMECRTCQRMSAHMSDRMQADIACQKICQLGINRENPIRFFSVFWGRRSSNLRGSKRSSSRNISAVAWLESLDEAQWF